MYADHPKGLSKPMKQLQYIHRTLKKTKKPSAAFLVVISKARYCATTAYSQALKIYPCHCP